MVQLHEVTREQAERYRDHVVAREPYRLGVLAACMKATDGPIDEMDASAASLVPLWEWVVGFAAAGFPGVPAHHVPSRGSQLIGPDLTPEQDEVRRAMVIAEALAHYVALVGRRADPESHWGLYLQSARVLEGEHHATGIRTSDGRFINVLTFLPVTVRRLLPEREMQEMTREPGRLHFLVCMRWPELTEIEQERLPNVLEEYSRFADVELPSDVARSALADWVAAPPTRASEDDEDKYFGAELTLAVGPERGLEDLSLLTPLPEVRVAELLAELDITHDDGRPATTAELLTHGLQLFAAESTVMVETAVADGALRALYLEPAGGGTAAHWDEIESRLLAFVTELGGHLVAVGPEDWPEP